MILRVYLWETSDLVEVELIEAKDSAHKEVHETQTMRNLNAQRT